MPRSFGALDVDSLVLHQIPPKTNLSFPFQNGHPHLQRDHRPSHPPKRRPSNQVKPLRNRLPSFQILHPRPLLPILQLTGRTIDNYWYALLRQRSSGIFCLDSQHTLQINLECLVISDSTDESMKGNLLTVYVLMLFEGGLKELGFYKRIMMRHRDITLIVVNCVS